MQNEKVLGGKGSRCVELKRCHIHVLILSGNFGSLRLLKPQEPVQTCTDIALSCAFVMVYCVKQGMTFEKGTGLLVATYPVYGDRPILSLCFK